MNVQNKFWRIKKINRDTDYDRKKKDRNTKKKQKNKK